jgi:hypothetical protein
MEEKMSLKQDLLDTIIKFIAKRKTNSLERAFMKNPSIISGIRDMFDSYSRLEKRLDDYCKKHPESCKDIKSGNVYLP